MRYCRVLCVIGAAAWLITGSAWAQTAEDKYMELMRQDIRNQKQALVDKAMGLDAAQKAQFWSIYAEYQKGLDAIWDQRVANIKKYAATIDSMTDEVAEQLAVKMMDLESQRAGLRKKYFGVYKEKMGARTAARFLQVESTLAYLLDLQLAAEIPILQ